MLKNVRLHKQFFKRTFELNKYFLNPNHRYFCDKSNESSNKDIQMDVDPQNIEIQAEKNWEKQDEITSERLRTFRKQNRMTIQKNLDTKIEVESDDLDQLIHDPRMNDESSGDYISLDSKSLTDTRSKLFDQQQSRIIRADKDSQFSKVVKDGQIDLSDEKVKVDSLDMSNTAMIDTSSFNKIDTAQIDLGKIDVQNKDQVSLEDVSLDNIPANLDIVINNEQKQAVAIGYFDKNAKDDKNLSKEIFEERSYQEFEKQNLYFLERDSFSQSLKEQFRRIILYSPILLLFAFFMESYMELYMVKSVNYNMDKSELKRWRNNLDN